MSKKLGFGYMRLPVTNSEDPTTVDYKEVNKMVDTFLERGFTYFDTAYMYHNFISETVIRETLVKRHPRESFTLATKMPTMFLKKEEDLERIFNEQLEKCGVDYFDYYLIHNLGVSHYEIAKKFKVFEFVQKKKEEGKIKSAGFSFHDNANLLEEILTAHPEVDFVQLQINYIDQLYANSYQSIFRKFHTSNWDEKVKISDNFYLTKRKQFFQDISDINTFDLIYFDAFGFTTQPELWSEAIFKIMFEALSPNGILVTYACRTSIKKAMLSVGFSIEKLPGAPGKSEMLRGKKV